MPMQQTEDTIRDYLDALLTGGDFAAFFADDVVWTTMETGEEIRGRQAVKDFIVALHSQWFQARPELRNVTAADGVAAIETFIDGWNERCQPFTWTKTPDEIIPRATAGQRISIARH